MADDVLSRINSLQQKEDEAKQQAREEKEQRRADRQRKKDEAKKANEIVVITDGDAHTEISRSHSNQIAETGAHPPGGIARPSPQTPQIAVQVNTPTQKDRPSNSLGIAAIVLGILAFLICWIPLIGLIGVPLSGLGMILALIGLLAALFRGGTGIGYPIAAVAINGLALFMAISITMATGEALSSMSEAINESRESDRATNQQVVNDNGEIVRGGGKANDPGRAVNPADDWADADETVQQGDIRVHVESVSIGTIDVTDIFGDKATSENKHLKINLRIGNVGDSKKIDFQGWSGADFTFDRDFATLKDNLGNSYKRITFGSSSKIDGQVKRESIYPESSITDLLVFEVPIEKGFFADYRG